MTPPLICVDPGHGGRDPGAVADGLRESDIALAHALALGAALERVGCAVLYTRTTDRYLTRTARAQAANENRARIFVSMHTNASIHPSRSGAQIIYRLQSAPAKAIATDVARYLDANIRPDEDGDAVPLPDQSPHTGYTNHALEVIAAKRPGQSDAAALREAGVVSPYRSLGVLRLTHMPAIMVEAGFITHAGDRARMLSPAATALMAAAIAAEISRALVVPA